MSDKKNEKKKIEKTKIIIVEGVDEENVINQFLEANQRMDIQVLPIGGKTFLKNNLESLRNDPLLHSLDRLAVLRDADSDPNGAFQSVCDALQSNGFVPPADQKIFSNGQPPVLVYILPGQGQAGSLENILLQSEMDNPVMPCIDQFFACVNDQQKQIPPAIGKAKIHALLSTKVEDPAKRVGEAAKKGWWNWRHEAFHELREIIELM